MKQITLEGGIKVITFAPPPDFNPLTASAADLEKHGFPAVPEDPHHRARYERLVNRLKHRVTFLEPTFRINADRVHGPRKRKVAEGTETSTNWSGGVVYAPAGQSFKWVEGDWVVPDVDAPTQGQWYYSSSWIGIDGDGSNDVFQAGVECEAYRSGSSITRSIYPWWEWFPAYEVQITNFPTNAGDYLTMLLCSTQGAGSTSGTVYFTNVTLGVTAHFTLSAPSGTKLAGNSAEWIVEAPTVNGGQSALADYGEVFFTVCEAVTASTTINGGTGNNINMTAGGKVVSDGNLITPTIVQCLFAGPQPA